MVALCGTLGACPPGSLPRLPRFLFVRVGLRIPDSGLPTRGSELRTPDSRLSGPEAGLQHEPGLWPPALSPVSRLKVHKRTMLTMLTEARPNALLEKITMLTMLVLNNNIL